MAAQPQRGFTLPHSKYHSTHGEAISPADGGISMNTRVLKVDEIISLMNKCIPKADEMPSSMSEMTFSTVEMPETVG